MTTSTITTNDLDHLGLTLPEFRRLAREGRFRSIVRGVWVESSVSDSIEVRAQAFGRVVGPHQIVVDRSAALLHGIDCFAWGEHEVVPPVEVCAVRGRARARHRCVEGGSRDLVAADVCEIGGVRVTTPLRTAADLGCRLRRREAFAALNAFAREFGVSRAELRRAVLRFKGRRGVIQLRELTELVDARMESPRESWLLLALLDAGLPAPEPQHWVCVDGEPTYRLDFAWVRRRVCIEYDGHEFHDDPARRAADERRRAWLRANGWTVIVVKLGDFDDQRLQQILAQVREALGSAYDSRRW